jgi:hypothetical protein
MPRLHAALPILAGLLLLAFISLGAAQSLAELSGGYTLTLPIGSTTTLLQICIPDRLGGELLLAAESTSSVEGNSALYTRAKTTK